MSIPNSVVIPLDKAWSADDFKHFIMAVGFASGMVDENATPEMKELYKQSAAVCEKFVSICEKRI